MKGVVLQTGGGVYVVALDDGRVVEASLRGRLKLEDRTGEQVVVGDRVEVDEASEETASEEAWTIEGVEPRVRELVRRGRGGRKAKVLAANVETLILVVAARDPEARRDQIDRFLVVGEANDLGCTLVVNKLDLEGAEDVARELADTYEPLGYPVVAASAVTGQGLDAVEDVLCAGRSVLVGPSGVGKSSLLNAVEPGLNLRVGELSRRRGTGRHTTVRARLIRLECGGEVADTPGFSDVGLWGVDPAELDGCFPEFRELVPRCRFRGCTHLNEPDCAVRAAVDEGEVDPERFASYERLMEEAQAAQHRF